MGVQSVKKGEFDFTPNSLDLAINQGKVGWWIAFDENCDYEHVGANAAHQGSWLKAIGRMYNLSPGNKHQDTCICGFRNNAKIHEIEVLDYWHVGGTCDNGIGRDPIGTINYKEVFAYWLEPNYSAKTVAQCFMIKDQKYSVTRQFQKLPRISWAIGGWAGGQIPAAQYMSFTADKIVKWSNGIPVKPQNL